MRFARAVVVGCALVVFSSGLAAQLAQQAYLKASSVDSADLFGTAVAVAGNTVVVGAPFEASNATGVNGDATNDSALAAGAANVFVRTGSGWTQQAYLKASNTGIVDEFGTAVAAWGDTVVVGAPFESSNASGINGNQADDSFSQAGAVYVFVRSGTTWSQQAYIKASNPDANDNFGTALAIVGDTLVVGSSREGSNDTGVNGNQANNMAFGAGAVYVFTRSGSTWTQQAYIKASNTDAGDEFGKAVALSGDTLVVGAPNEDSNASGVGGDGSNNTSGSAGAAYVFVRSGGTWSQQAYLKASSSSPGDMFGGSVAVSGDTVVVGSAGEDSNASGINGDESNNSGGGSGAAYVFVRSGATWSQQAYVKASNTNINDAFGKSVGLQGDTLVVGAYTEDSNATGVNGNQADNSAGDAGAVYTFQRSGATWSQQSYVKPSNTGGGDQFGIAVAISGGTIVAGAVNEDSNATGVNGDGSNNSLISTGAAYVFGDPAWSHLGFALPGTAGAPTLTGTGTLVAASPTSLDLANAKPSAPCGLFVGLTYGPAAFKGGTLVPVPKLLLLTFTSSPSGTVTLPFAWPTGLPSGFGIYYQYAIKDAAAVQGVALSNALKSTTP